MRNEDWRVPERPEIDPGDRLAWNHREIRKEAKDLRTILGQTPKSFLHRERLFQIVDEILSLVPVLDPEDEVRDDEHRKRLHERIQSTVRRRQNPAE
jgi:hypothetical protein